MMMSPSRSPSVICPGPHLVIGMRPRPAVCVRSRLDVRMSAAKTASVSKGSSLLSARVVSRFEMIEKPFLSLARRMALPMALPSCIISFLPSCLYSFLASWAASFVFSRLISLYTSSVPRMGRIPSCLQASMKAGNP